MKKSWQEKLDWILKKNKRSTKKRKAQSSPETSLHEHNRTLKSTETTNIVKEVNTPLKQHVPPPIIATGVKTFGDLKKITQNEINNECKFTSHNNNVWKINVLDSESYRKITEELTRNKIQWHTYEEKNIRPTKVMAKGLHLSCAEEEITTDLTSKGYNILEAKNIFKKEITTNKQGEQSQKKRELQIFMFTFHNKENIENIHNIKSIMKISVRAFEEK